MQRKKLKNKSVLILHKVLYRRGSQLIFYNINCSLQPGTCLIIKGENGTGKSTLLKCLINYLSFSNGTLFYDDKILRSMKKISNQINILNTEEQLKYSFFSVLQNITFWNNLLTHKCLTKYNIILKLLYLTQYRNTSVKWLSLGQTKRLLMAFLLTNPNFIWVLDEPLIGLDYKSVELFQKLIRNHQQHGGIAILVSHTNLLLNRSVSIQL